MDVIVILGQVAGTCIESRESWWKNPYFERKANELGRCLA